MDLVEDCDKEGAGEKGRTQHKVKDELARAIFKIDLGHAYGGILRVHVGRTWVRIREQKREHLASVDIGVTTDASVGLLRRLGGTSRVRTTENLSRDRHSVSGKCAIGSVGLRGVSEKPTGQGKLQHYRDDGATEDDVMLADPHAGINLATVVPVAPRRQSVGMLRRPDESKVESVEDAWEILDGRFDGHHSCPSGSMLPDR